MHTKLNNKKEVVIGDDKPFVIIGEKINPTGIKKLGQALVDQNFDYVKYLAQRQVAWGADVLDVNVGHPQIEEAGLKVAPGKPLVNSVNGEDRQLATVLPIVKDRGAAVIGMAIGNEGIPPTAEGRLAAAGTIIERATKLGIPVEDIIIDPLVMTVGHNSNAGLVTLKSIELIKKEYGVNI